LVLVVKVKVITVEVDQMDGILLVEALTVMEVNLSQTAEDQAAALELLL
jgi:hypothetical protein